jgi:hypothetical protein
MTTAPTQPRTGGEQSRSCAASSPPTCSCCWTGTIPTARADGCGSTVRLTVGGDGLLVLRPGFMQRVLPIPVRDRLRTTTGSASRPIGLAGFQRRAAQRRGCTPHGRDAAGLGAQPVSREGGVEPRAAAACYRSRKKPCPRRKPEAGCEPDLRSQAHDPTWNSAKARKRGTRFRHGRAAPTRGARLDDSHRCVRQWHAAGVRMVIDCSFFRQALCSKYCRALWGPASHHDT